MKIISGNVVKEAISNHILQSREWLVICTYSTDISPVEYYHFMNLIENGVRIELITGKKPDAKVISNLTKLFNIALHFSENLHSKIYINESSVIVTSCNFGRLNIQKYHETGVYFEKSDYPKQYKEEESEVRQLLQGADLIIPMLPFKPAHTIDLRTFLFEKEGEGRRRKI